MEHAKRSRVRQLLVVAIVGLVLASAGVAWGAWFNPEQRLTTNAADQRWPEISGTKVVFEDYRQAREVGDVNDPDTLYDIRVLDLTTMTSKDLTPYETAVSPPAISGNNVVWVDYGHGTAKGGIYHYNLKTGAKRRLPITSGRELRISGNRVVYETSNQIWVYNVVTGFKKRVTPVGAIAGVPDISGTRIVWQDHRNDHDFDVYLYDLLTSTETRITTDAHDQEFPRISGNHIVWEDDRHGILDDDVYLYDLATRTESRITTDPARQFRPVVSGDLIAWQDERHVTPPGNNTEIYVYDVRNGVEKRATNDSWYQGNPSISGDRIVYDDHLRPGIPGMDVYLTSLSRPRISVTSASSIAYGARARMTGTLKSASGALLASRTVTLEASKDKAAWVSVDSTVTNGAGAYTLYSSPLATKRYLRVRFAGDADDPSGVSSAVLVKARVYFSSAPRLKTHALNDGSTYRVWGYFRPEHRSNSSQIKVRAYHYQKLSNGKFAYVYRKTFRTTTSNPAGYTYTKYTGYLRLPYPGKWRLRAYHSEDTNNATSFSSYRYVTVK